MATELLKAKRDTVKKDVGVDTKQQKKYDELQRWLSQRDTSFRRLELEIKDAEAARTRRKEFIDLRRKE